MNSLTRRIAVLVGVLSIGSISVAQALAPVADSQPEENPPQIVSYSVWSDFKGELSVTPPTSAKCPQIWQTAVDVGWKLQDLPTLDKVVERESKCSALAFNPDDPNGGSIGLLQINKFWCKGTSSYPNGYLQSTGVIARCKQLFDPIVNLSAGLEIFNYSKKVNRNGWNPWRL